MKCTPALTVPHCRARGGHAAPQRKPLPCSSQAQRAAELRLAGGGHAGKGPPDGLEIDHGLLFGRSARGGLSASASAACKAGVGWGPLSALHAHGALYRPKPLQCKQANSSPPGRQALAFFLPAWLLGWGRALRPLPPGCCAGPPCKGSVGRAVRLGPSKAQKPHLLLFGFLVSLKVHAHGTLPPLLQLGMPRLRTHAGGPGCMCTLVQIDCRPGAAPCTPRHYLRVGCCALGLHRGDGGFQRLDVLLG